MATSSEMAAQAAGMTLEAYLAKRAGLIATLPASPTNSVVPSPAPPTLTPMPTMPAAPTMPSFTMPSMAAPTMPTLQPTARMPSQNDLALDEARDKQKLTIAQRAGRKSTFLTSRQPRAALPTIAAPAQSRYAASTAG